MSFWKLIALVHLLQEVCDVFLEADCLGVSLAGHQGNQLPKRHRRPHARDTPRQSASKKTPQTSCKRYTKAISFQKDIADLLQEIHQGNQLPKRHRRPPARETPRQSASKKTSQTSCKRYTKAISFQKDIADLLQEIHQGNHLPKSRER
jgi:hypothetical protein